MGALLEPGLPLLIATLPDAGGGGGLEEASVFIPGGGAAPVPLNTPTPPVPGAGGGGLEVPIG